MGDEFASAPHVATSVIAREQQLTARLEQARRGLPTRLSLVPALNDRAATARAISDTHQLSEDLARMGRFGEAREVLGMLQRSPLASRRVDLASTVPAGEVQAGGRDVRTPAGLLRIDHALLTSTVGEQAELRSRQLALADRASQALGRPADLRTFSDASAYFRALGRRGDPEHIRAEFAEYAQSHFVHCGGMDWNTSTPPDARPGALTSLHSNLPRDAAGRALIDCEGFGYLAHRLLGDDARDAHGQPWFQVSHAVANDRSHVMSLVQTVGGRGFVVNNDQVSPMQGTAELRRALDPRFRWGLDLSAAHAHVE